MLKLIAVTDGQHSVAELAKIIIAIKDVIDFVQIREKKKSPKEIIALLEHLQKEGVPNDKIIINDRIDIALCMNIPQVQLPETGLPIELVKKNIPHLKLGRSVHSLEGAKEAQKMGADYVLYGHCFETNSKKGVQPNGLEKISQMKEELTIPIYAIGGITVDKIPLMKELKVEGIAVMSSIFSATNPYSMAKGYYEAIHNGTKV